MRKTLFGLAILTFVCTFACAPKKSATKARAGTSSGVAVQQFASKSEAEKAIKNWQVSCDSSADCPDYVAEMVVGDGKTATICTATLIAPDLMLTNSHCFEDKAVADADACQRTKFVFADKSASGPESVVCKAVVSKSDIIDEVYDRPDYMVLRLDHALTRQAATVSRAGLKNHEVLTLHKVDYDAEAGGGMIVTGHCKILQGTSFLPDSVHDTDPVMVTRDCDVRPGNSGSPLINDKGEVNAIAFASVDHDDATEKKEALAGNMIALQKSKAEMAHFTNLACLKLPSPIAAASAACAATDKAKAKTASSVAAPAASGNPNLDPKAHWPAIQSAVATAVQAHKDLIDTKFGYHAVLSKDNGSILSVPYCFLAPATWLSQYQQGSTLQTSADVKPIKMKWALNWMLNDDLQVIPMLTEAADPSPIEIEFNPAQLKTTGTTTVKYVETGKEFLGKTCSAVAGN